MTTPEYLDPVRHELHQLRATLKRIETLRGDAEDRATTYEQCGPDYDLHARLWRSVSDDLRAALADKEPTP